MQDTQILSSHAAAPVSGASGDPTLHSDTAPSLVFDACHLGLVVRAVVGVQAAVAATSLFSVDSLNEWLLQLALLTAGTLPATILWLLAISSLKQLLHRQTPLVHSAVGTSLGALAGLYGCTTLALTGLVPAPPWWASLSAAHCWRP